MGVVGFGGFEGVKERGRGRGWVDTGGSGWL